MPEDTSGAGEDGREVELKNDGATIQWRYAGEDDSAWRDLVALDVITGADGKEVQLQVADGYIQWKYDADSDWQNLIAVSALQGMKGDKGDQGEKGEKGEKGEPGEQRESHGKIGKGQKQQHTVHHPHQGPYISRCLSGHGEKEKARIQGQAQEQKHHRGWDTGPEVVPEGVEKASVGAAFAPANVLDAAVVEGGGCGADGHHRQTAQQKQHAEHYRVQHPAGEAEKGAVRIEKTLKHGGSSWIMG